MGVWFSNEVRVAHGVGLWNNIRNGWEVFVRFISFVMARDLESDFGIYLVC